MTTFHFDLVSPERLLYSGEVTQVDVPGEEGDFGVFAGHAPYVATLRPGVLKVCGEGQPLRIAVHGGFAEVGPKGLTVLAETATPVDEIDAAMTAQAIKDAEEDLSDAKDDATRDRAQHRLEHFRALQAALGH